MDKNPVGWFEIPVSKMERAMKFYETVFDVRLTTNKSAAVDMAMFPMIDAIGAAGSLVCNKQHYKPSADGILIYFTTPSGDLDEDLRKVKRAGGMILRPKTLISKDIGYMGLFLDTEGNRIAIHSRK